MKLTYSDKERVKDLKRHYNALCKYEMKLRSIVADLSPIIADIEDCLAELENK